MARLGAGIAGCLMASLLGACGSTGTGGTGGGLLSASPLDLFHQSAKATKGGTEATGPVVDTEYDCPEVKIRYGAATLMIGDKPGQQGEPNPLNVRYQGSIQRTARECHLAGNIMTMKVGVEGRVITGPAGGPGTIDVPLRVVVVQESVAKQKVIVSKFERQTVTLNAAVDRAPFTLIDPDISFPLPNPVTDISQYVVYVGFDPLGAQMQKKKPVRKRRRHHRRPKGPPRSS